jgi:V4R domain-containing protein
MSRSGGGPREIAVPVSVFGSLRSELEKEAGMLPTVRALHQAGYQAGLAAAAEVNQEAGGDSFALSQDKFWSQLSGYFSNRGWGTLGHRASHPGVGILTSTDWAEANGEDVKPDASCSFSTGFLSGMLSQLAGAPVAVLEVMCRTRGADSCDFAFGSESAIHDLYGRLLDGAELDSALEAL